MKNNFPISKFKIFVKKFLFEKFDTEEFVGFIDKNKNKVEIFTHEINSAISYFNKIRIKFDTNKNYKFLINAKEFNDIYNNDLPDYFDTVDELFENKNLTNQIFLIFKNDKYFKDVWKTKSYEILLANLLILIYRTTLLQKHKDKLIDKETGNNRVQISSTIEEMIFSMKLEGIDTDLFHSTKHWLVNWKEEGFSEELFEKMKFL